MRAPLPWGLVNIIAFHLHNRKWVFLPWSDWVLLLGTNALLYGSFASIFSQPVGGCLYCAPAMKKLFSLMHSTCPSLRCLSFGTKSQTPSSRLTTAPPVLPTSISVSNLTSNSSIYFGFSYEYKRYVYKIWLYLPADGYDNQFLQHHLLKSVSVSACILLPSL